MAAHGGLAYGKDSAKKVHDLDQQAKRKQKRQQQQQKGHKKRKISASADEKMPVAV